jgi:hypothetical protein
LTAIRGCIGPISKLQSRRALGRSITKPFDSDAARYASWAAEVIHNVQSL